MKILYLNYWGLRDPLAQATVHPSIRCLANLSVIDAITVVSIERSNVLDVNEVIPPIHEKINYVQLRSGGKSLGDKFNDFVQFPSALAVIGKKNEIERMIGRGALAGALLYLVWRKTQIPFFVESFEPHSDYMLESFVWKRWSLRYQLQKFFERKQMKHASGLMPVSENYKVKLLKSGIDETKIRVVPCTVDVDQFGFNQLQRDLIRAKLRIAEDSIAAIYVGKFGDIYFDLDQSIKVFKESQDRYENRFHLILITGHEPSIIRRSLVKAGIQPERIHILYLNHSEVSSYLSASDFAYALIKPAPSKKYCSAIKIGEYWACGLPVVIPPDIGDDSEIIDNNRAGTIMKNGKSHLQKIDDIINETDHRKRITNLAVKFRSPEKSKIAYSYFFNDQYINKL